MREELEALSELLYEYGVNIFGFKLNHHFLSPEASIEAYLFGLVEQLYV